MCDNCSSEILKHSSIYYRYLAYAGIWENMLSQWKKNQFCVFKSWLKKTTYKSQGHCTVYPISFYVSFSWNTCHSILRDFPCRVMALFVFLEPFYLKECHFLKKYQSTHKISMQKRKLKVMRTLIHVPVDVCITLCMLKILQTEDEYRSPI